MTPHVRRPPVVVSLSVAYALAGLVLGSFLENPYVQFAAPAALLLTGYWLSGLFFRHPQPWLEQRLLASDRWLFDVLNVGARLARVPRAALELLEAAYASVYVVAGVGGLFMAMRGPAAGGHYWDLVLTAGLACYVALPWLRSRPPRALEGPGTLAARRPRLRVLNTAILDRASVQANTIPSGHVAVVLAAAFAVFSESATTGWMLVAMSLVVATAAVLGRYHYAADCVSGAVVAVLVWWLLG